MKEHYDVIIVGTGAAGLYCALNLPEKMKILLITKQEADQSDSFLAQGGICMLRGEDDYENYFEDTMRAGHYENNKRAVDLMIRSSNDIIRDLLRYHVDFARDGLGNLAFTREGAHSQPRILFHEDITGKEITQTLLTAAKIKENIEICEYMTMVDLISKDNTVCGIIAMDRNDQAFPVYSQYVVLACGGIGGLFKNSTNFSHIAGDGVGIIMWKWKIWTISRFIRQLSIQRNPDGVSWFQNQSEEKVLFCMIRTDSVLQTNYSREIC
jgi:L-aspartate oxidase